MLRKLYASFALILALALCIPEYAHAAGATSTVTITAPTTYSSGEAVAPSDVASYVLTWAPIAPQHGPSGTLTVTATGATTVVQVPVPCGSVSFTATATTASAAEYPGITSNASTPPIAYASGIVCKLNPPGLAAN